MFRFSIGHDLGRRGDEEDIFQSPSTEMSESVSKVSGLRAYEVTKSSPDSGKEPSQKQAEPVLIINQPSADITNISQMNPGPRRGRSQHRGQVGEHRPRNTGRDRRGTTLSCLSGRGFSTEFWSESIRRPITLVNSPGWRHCWSNPRAVSLHLGEDIQARKSYSR